LKGKPHAHSPLVGRHSDSPDHPDLVAALNAQPKTISAEGGFTTRGTVIGPPRHLPCSFSNNLGDITVAKKPKLLSDLFDDRRRICGNLYNGHN
jgi:hypothetical protein